MAPSFERPGSRFWILLATLVAVAVWAAAFAGTLRAVGKPYPGFGFTADLVVTTLGTSGARGLEQFDEIVALDGVTVTSAKAFDALLDHRTMASTIDISVLRQGRPATAQAVLRPYTWHDWLHLGPLLIAALLHLAIGSAVAWLRPRAPAARALFVFTVGVTAGLASATDYDSGRVLPPLALGFNFLLALAAVHLALVFPVFSPLLKDRPRRIALLYLPALALGTAVLCVWGHDRAISIAVFQAMITAQACAFLLLLGMLIRRSSGPYSVERDQARLALMGAAAAYLPFIATWIVPSLFGLEAPPALATASLGFIMLFPVAMAVGIVRHQMFDIDVVIRRTASYTAIVVILGAGYLLMTGGLRFVLNRLFGEGGELPGILSTAVIALAFAPVRDRITAVMNRVFSREKYDFARITSTFAAETRGAKDLAKLFDTFRAVLERAFGTRRVEIVLRKDLELSAEDAAAAVRAGVSSPAAPIFEGACLHAPLVAGNDLLGIVAVGPRASDLPYSATDRLLLANLTQQLAGAVQIAALVEEVAAQERLKRDVEIARDVQYGLLLKDLPVIPDFEMVAWSLPAYEIGGDFYDLLQIDEEHWGIIVGDVVGKGIPAALLSAATLSAFRAIAPGLASPSEVLVRLNAFLHRYKPSNKLFVAAQYWVVNVNTGAIRIANAGQPLPLFNGQPLELKGFPLGVDRRVRYREIAMALSPGDALVGYSDGLEDIRNSEGEAFGLARVLPLAASCSDRGLGEVGERLKAVIEGFASGRSRFDDVTVIALRRRAASAVGERPVATRVTTFLTPTIDLPPA